MAYELIVTERADELLDNLVFHLLYNLENEKAAVHLINEVSKIYDRIQDNPFQFPMCRDEYLNNKKYREAMARDMNYIVIFKIDNDIVYIMGIFHELEDYTNKM